MLMLPTEEILERELAKAGFGLGGRVYYEEFLFGAEFESTIGGVPMNLNDLMKEDRQDEALELALGMTPVRLAVALGDVPFFRRTTRDPKKLLFQGYPVIKYEVFPSDKLEQQFKTNPMYRENADRIICNRNEMVGSEGIGIEEVDDNGTFPMCSIAVSYPGYLFTGNMFNAFAKVRKTFKGMGQRGVEYATKMQALNGRPYEPNVAVELITDIAKLMRDRTEQT